MATLTSVSPLQVLPPSPLLIEVPLGSSLDFLSSLHSPPQWSHLFLGLTYVLLTCKVLFPFHASPLNARLVFIGLPGCLISIFKHKMSKMKFLFFLSNPAPFPFPSQFMADPFLQFARVKKWSHPSLAFILHVQSISWHLASVFKACLESATFHHHPSSNHQYFSLELLPSLLVCLLPVVLGHLQGVHSTALWGSPLQLLCSNPFHGFLSLRSQVRVLTDSWAAWMSPSLPPVSICVSDLPPQSLVKLSSSAASWHASSSGLLLLPWLLPEKCGP